MLSNRLHVRSSQEHRLPSLTSLDHVFNFQRTHFYIFYVSYFGMRLTQVPRVFEIAFANLPCLYDHVGRRVVVQMNPSVFIVCVLKDPPIFIGVGSQNKRGPFKEIPFRHLGMVFVLKRVSQSDRDVLSDSRPKSPNYKRSPRRAPLPLAHAKHERLILNNSLGSPTTSLSWRIGGLFQSRYHCLCPIQRT